MQLCELQGVGFAQRVSEITPVDEGAATATTAHSQFQRLETRVLVAPASRRQIFPFPHISKKSREDTRTTALALLS
jgi:hypothetical protein